MKIIFLKNAQVELDNAIDFYTRERSGLGKTFLNEVLKALNLIGQFPKAWTPFSKRTRRFLLRRFPFCIINQIGKKEILIIAIAHQNRKPDYWKDRV